MPKCRAIDIRTLTIERSRFDEFLHLRHFLDVSFRDFIKVKSIKLKQLGSKEVIRDFAYDGYIFHYINKERRCNMRFNESVGSGTIRVNDPKVDSVVIEVEYEYYRTES